MTVRPASRLAEGAGTIEKAGHRIALPPRMPSCPFATRGLDDESARACPGYRPESVSFHGIGAGESIGRRDACTHLDTQRGVRGFVTACMHPGGLPPGADEVAQRLPSPGATRSRG
jgi:hypothetical protein